jgi:hypothetical protein
MVLSDEEKVIINHQVREKELNASESLKTYPKGLVVSKTVGFSSLKGYCNR